MGLNEGACNHLTAMAPAKNGLGEEVMLVIPGKGVSINYVDIFLLTPPFVNKFF